MIKTVANYTLREILKSKIMIAALLLAVAIIVVSYVASELSYGVPSKVTLEFGIGCMSLTAISISIILGVNLIYSEIENRTVYMTLSRPITRTQFIIGKVFGFSMFLALFITLLGVLTSLLYVVYEGKLNPLIYMTFFNIYLESLIALLIVVMFSLVSNQTLSFIFTLSILIAGHTINDVKNLGIQQENELLINVASYYGYIFPDLSRLSLRDYVIYDQNVDLSLVLNTSFYGLCYSAFIMAVIIYLFRRKNLD